MVWAASLSTTDLSTRSLTADYISLAFGVYLRLVTGMDPSPKQCSTSKNLNVDASPKAISERTSYLQVRLDFSATHKSSKHFFNVPWFGPPVRLPTFNLLMGRSHGFRSHDMILMCPIQTRFPLRLRLFNLTSHQRNSPVHSTKGTLSPINGLELVVGTRFQVLFHLLPGCFHLSSRYWFNYRSLGSIWGWEMVLPDSDEISRVPAVLRILLGTKTILNTRLLLFWPTFPTILL